MTTCEHGKLELGIFSNFQGSTLVKKKGNGEYCPFRKSLRGKPS